MMLMARMMGFDFKGLMKGALGQMATVEDEGDKSKKA